MKVYWLIICFLFLLENHLKAAPNSIDNFREYCDFETFHARCKPNKEIIIITSALYGRMRIGRCVGEDFGILGCYDDVTAIADVICSGRSNCSIRVPDPRLNSNGPCFKEFKVYLEISYRCHRVSQAYPSCTISLNSDSEQPDQSIGVPYFTPSQADVSLDRSLCGLDDVKNNIAHSKVPPSAPPSSLSSSSSSSSLWVIQATEGQHILVSWTNFLSGLNHHGIKNKTRTSNDITCSESQVRVATLREKQSILHLCWRQELRHEKLFTSVGSRLTLEIHRDMFQLLTDILNMENDEKPRRTERGATDGEKKNRNRIRSLAWDNEEMRRTVEELVTEDTKQYFALIHFRAEGCANLRSSAGAWMERTEDELVVGCHHNHQTWHLYCQNNRWIGVVGNCSSDKFVVQHQMSLRSLSSQKQMLIHVLSISGVLLISVFISFIIVLVGYLTIKRSRTQKSRRAFESTYKPSLKSTTLHDALSESADEQEILQVHTKRRYNNPPTQATLRHLDGVGGADVGMMGIIHPPFIRTTNPTGDLITLNSFYDPVCLEINERREVVFELSSGYQTVDDGNNILVTN